ncbi:leucine-rich repeat-containing protein 23-like [Orbicella faveolata]|uniref:leucine-rich repeat-containing protein 23-like n=1 Tax=Orbicella faveolata TaxID=48498 RepID=UPI0009E59C08|nr:leucine-rich repeat-containing protein 23-like [Orbicella faveolata]
MSDFEDDEGVDEPVLDDENDEEGTEEEEKPPENPLTEEMLADSLSLLCKTGDGLAHAYVRLDIHEKIQTAHTTMPHLFNLELVNEIVEVSGFDPNKLGRLRVLELRGNKLMTTVGLSNLPNLKELYMGANTIRTLEGLDRLEHLSKLHLRDNQIEKLDGFSENMKNLQYINLRGNNVTDMKEIAKLKSLPLLRALLLMECPVSDEDDYRIEVLISLRRLERLDKDEYTDDERQEAEEIYEQRRQEEALATGTQEVIHTDEDD